MPSEPAPTEQGKEPSAKPWDVIALELARGAGIELYCDFAGQASIRLPEDLPEVSWPLRSQRVRDWLAHRFASEHGTNYLLLDREIDRVLNVLAGEAWKADRRNLMDRHLWEKIEAEPVLLFTVVYMESRQSQSLLMEDYREKLHALADENPKLRPIKKLPKRPNTLSFILQDNQELLRQAGIEVSVNRTNHGAVLNLAKVTVRSAEKRGSSPGSSSLKSKDQHVFDQSDDQQALTPEEQALAAILTGGE